MVSVSSPVSLAMLFAPQLVAVTCRANVYALWAGWFDTGARFQHRGRGDDEHGAMCVTHGALRYGTEQQAFQAFVVVRAEQNQVSAQIGGQLYDCVPCIIEHCVRNDSKGWPERGVRGRVRCQLLLDVRLESLKSRCQQWPFIDRGGCRDGEACVIALEPRQCREHVDLRSGSLGSLSKCLVKCAIGELRIIDAHQQNVSFVRHFILLPFVVHRACQSVTSQARCASAKLADATQALRELPQSVRPGVFEPSSLSAP